MACSSSIIGVPSVYQPNPSLDHHSKKPTSAPPLNHPFSAARHNLRAFSSSRPKSSAGFSISFVPSAVVTPNSSVLSEEAFKGFGSFGNVSDGEFGDESEEEGEFEETEEAASVDELDVAKLRLPQRLVDTLEKRGITELFPIQRAVSVPALAGRDIIARAKTGTGKTLAFGIPILKGLDDIEQQKGSMRRGRLPKALVLAPTTAFHNPCKSQLLKPFSFHRHSFSFRPSTIRFPSISTSTNVAISARYGGGGGFRKPKPSEEDEALNISSIKSDTVRIIDAQQNMVGLVTKAQAFQMAEAVELDLVILSPDADPPVLRIMDYNKYRYEQQKKKRDQQKKTAASRMDLKELKMGYNIDVHDYSVRLRSAQKFLKDGDKVKVIVSLKGRENEFRNNAIELLRRFQNDVGELAVEEAKSFRDRNMFLVLVPNKAIAQKSQEPPKKKDDSVVNEVSASVS